MPQHSSRDSVARALRDCLISPNEQDSNGEPATIVDALYEVARGLQAIAKQLERMHPADGGEKS